MAKILVVEDDAVLLNLYQSVLDQAGFETFVAYDGSEGLRLAKKHDPELVLLDLMMPKTNGFEFLQSLGVKDNPQVKVIVFSNTALPEQMQLAKDLGAIDYVLKAASFTPKQILEIVHKALKS